jgi:hypothetical protein
MFGRKNKDKGAVGTLCPYCEYNNPLGSETCEQCYYELNKSARDQPMATPTTSNDDIMSLLLGDNEFEEEAHEVVEAVLTMDDVTVDVGQYDLPVPAEDDEGEPVPESFEFIGSHGPTLSQTVVATEEEEEVELTAADAPKEYIEFDIGTVDPLDEVAEPVHTGKGGLYSPTVSTPNDDDLLGVVGPASNGATPDLPDLPDDDEQPSGSLTQAIAQQAPVPVTPAPLPPATTPELPDLPDDDETEASPDSVQPAAVSVPEAGLEDLVVNEEGAEDDNRIWPWPKGEPWTPTQVYQEVVAAMEHVKHGRMEQAATTLDTLGPHLDLNLDMLLHISVLMQHLGRHDHVKWTLDMAAYVHPNDAHVQQARAQVLV